jgi:tRNA 2-thiouridine synthesizing protein A
MTVTQFDRQLDARFLACPMPIVKTAQLMKQMTSGQIVQVLATDAGAVKDFEAWSKSTGNELIESTMDGATFCFVLRKN